MRNVVQAAVVAVVVTGFGCAGAAVALQTPEQAPQRSAGPPEVTGSASSTPARPTPTGTRSTPASSAPSARGTATRSPAPRKSPTPRAQRFDPRGDPDAAALSSVATQTPDTVLRRRKAAAAALGMQGVCLGASATPVLDGRPIVVSIPPMTFTVGKFPASAWTKPPSRDAGWQLWFYSMRWAAPIAQRAAQDGQKRSVTAVVDQVLRFYKDHPDQYPAATRPGWDEGASLRRLETLNCLYAASKDPRLPAAMAKEVAVQSGPRYYGPPRFGVHNHGLMANQRVVIAGRLTGRADWVRLGQRRLVAEAPLAFSPAGMTYEQSAGYHLVNYAMWDAAATLLATIDPADPTPTRMRATLGAALRAGQWLTEPDGGLVQLGDTGRVAGRPGTGAPGMFRDDRTGYLLGRWSWTDPKTTYYSVRYGAARWAHGHFDKASLTWSTRGSRILVGPGYTTLDAYSTATPWHRLPQSHNVAAPQRAAFNPRGTAALRAATQKGAVASSTVDDYSYSVAHRRVSVVDNARGSLNVVDTFGGKATGRQTWHLDPAWKLVKAPANGSALWFRHPSGRVLTVSTTGRLSGVLRGSTRPFAGWNYVSTTQRVPAYEFTIRSTSSLLRTSFSVR